VPLFEGIGSHGRRVTTTSAAAQRYFDQGLSLVFAFNHDEAIRSFREAAEIDPSCAMAWWGVALASGPHINNPVVPPARALAAGGTAVERALIEAQATRYADPPPEDRRPLDEAYADAMRRVWRQFPDDPDVGALFAEALMDLRPWHEDRLRYDEPSGLGHRGGRDRVAVRPRLGGGGRHPAIVLLLSAGPAVSPAGPALCRGHFGARSGGGAAAGSSSPGGITGSARHSAATVAPACVR
jgi:hypothetical protein